MHADTIYVRLNVLMQNTSHVINSLSLFGHNHSIELFNTHMQIMFHISLKYI